MNPTDIVVGRQYIVKVRKEGLVPVEVIEVVQNLVKFRCAQSYRCLIVADHKPLNVPCAAQFVRFAVAKDTGAYPCGMLTLVNDHGWYDKRKCVLPVEHRGKCLTSLYLLEGVPVDREAEDWVNELMEDSPSDYAPVFIPRANWPRFEL